MLVTMVDDRSQMQGFFIIIAGLSLFLCLAIWWDRERAIANSQSQLGSRELSPGISPGILIRGMQGQLESRVGTCQHLLAYAGTC